MSILAPGIHYIDLQFRGVPNVIATAVLETDDGILLIDPGPSVTIPHLSEQLADLGMDLIDVSGILLTHIHLDHGGATGMLLQAHPKMRLYVHERGAPHMVNPTKLLDSARRLYGDSMDSLWGPVLPVPSDSVTILGGGERLNFASKSLDVAYTPGHASHHVCYFDNESGVAFCGDAGGVRIAPLPSVLPPTPPPDIDIELWKTSIARIREWAPAKLFLTHFGPVDDVPADHLSKLEERLVRYAERVKLLLESPLSDSERLQSFQTDFTTDLLSENLEEDVQKYRNAAPIDQCYLGLVRYWTKKWAQTKIT